MHCRTCNSPIRDHLLLCKKCLGENFYKSNLEYQLVVLPSVIRGKAQLLIITKDGRRHIALFENLGQAYCGIALDHVQSKFKERVSKPPVNACTDCLGVLAPLWKKARDLAPEINLISGENLEL